MKTPLSYLDLMLQLGVLKSREINKERKYQNLTRKKELQHSAQIEQFTRRQAENIKYDNRT